MERYKSKREINDEKRKRKRRWVGRVILITLLSIVGAIIFNFYQGYVEYANIERKIAAVEDDILELERVKSSLETQVEDINSPDFIEQIAREELGLVKKGEMLYIIIED
ncbi:FtsB family cell division protein [Halonatronum saccharophilum]|uniref:FtsB family cell division protein n=1 Tax=Halonatronum saccharophilum TaxID=150060 RepID=UPI0004B21500|nr:septum formation initiator family protein [Halonatronum saccharophilum]